MAIGLDVAESIFQGFLYMLCDLHCSFSPTSNYRLAGADMYRMLHTTVPCLDLYLAIFVSYSADLLDYMNFTTASGTETVQETKQV